MVKVSSTRDEKKLASLLIDVSRDSNERVISVGFPSVITTTLARRKRGGIIAVCPTKYVLKQIEAY